MVADTRGKIDLRLYASVKDLLGKDRIDVDWTDNMTAGDVRKKLSESFPILSVVNAQFTISVNRRVVGDRELIQKTDELAILPPISGGWASLGYLTYEIIDVNKLLVDHQNTSVGGTVMFLGTVREYGSENLKLLQLSYEAYKTMAEEIFSDIESEAKQKWKIEKIKVLHRIGTLNVGEVSVVIIVSSKHRKEAFDCCRYVIDNVKTRVPIWKMERTNRGKKWLGGTLILPTKK